MSALYSLADRVLLRPLGPDRGHQLALLGLRLGLFPAPRVADAFQWRGITFPNRVGVAAGFDKNAVAVAGLARIGAGFAEIGTILTQPWAGNPLRPRLARLEAEQGVWNRLGFPSDGLARVAARLARAKHGEMVVACNIAPHPLTVRGASEPGFAARARAELSELVTALDRHAQLFVINLSSPNTSGLRGVLYGDGFAQELVAPTRARLAALAREHGREPTPLLVKLPPETPERAAWSPDTLAALVKPLARPDVCDGFVAVNTSIGLALAKSPHARPDAPGGVSGAPLRDHALAGMRALRELAHPEQLRIGVGGVMSGADALALSAAGAQLVEIYSGMIYRGPGLVGECATALRDARPPG
ncbi:MAG: dihydroorotate dehydrogenase 2 [Deltaproteobacteria bacterium]|nr:dihydroorotate dehydrogenase 2 [Deltaproteobacteria bacterium]